VFHTDAAKVDRDVVYAAMVCTSMLQASIPSVPSVFQIYFASVFIWMLHMFHAYVASVLSGYCVCFVMVLRCFCKCFKRMF
jgi:hypothetical protein